MKFLFRNIFRQAVLITAGVFIFFAVVINMLIEDPHFDDPYDKADYYIRVSEPEKAEPSLIKILKEDSTNIYLHKIFIDNHFEIQPYYTSNERSYIRKDGMLKSYYHNTLARSRDSILYDIGNYGAGWYEFSMGELDKALEYFSKVRNRQLPYLNNSIGVVYSYLDSIKLAEVYYREELRSGGDSSLAYPNLIKTYTQQGNEQGLSDLTRVKAALEYFPHWQKQGIFFKENRFPEYFSCFFDPFSAANIWVILAAFLIMASWAVYLWQVDIYEKEKLKYMGIALMMGMSSVFFVGPLSDALNIYLNFDLNGGFINDFFYCVIGIGAVEELVKIVPVLILLRYTKGINEPFDYIFYASLSALGFAFVENILYFSNYGLHIIHGRALTAVVAHMFFSSVIAYGMVLNKYKRYKNPVVNFLTFFGLASLAHGFYDFWLFNHTASTFSLLTFIFLLAAIRMWNSFKNNALNNSSFYDRARSINAAELQDYLVYALAGILLFEYIATALYFNPHMANKDLVSSLTAGTYLILFLSDKLSRFSLFKGEWAPIEFFGKGNYDYNQALGKKAIMKPLSNNANLASYLPDSGTILQRLNVSGETYWYLINLNTSHNEDPEVPTLAVIRAKEKSYPVREGKETIVAFFLPPEELNLENPHFQKGDFNFLGWARIQLN